MHDSGSDDRCSSFTTHTNFQMQQNISFTLLWITMNFSQPCYSTLLGKLNVRNSALESFWADIESGIHCSCGTAILQWCQFLGVVSRNILRKIGMQMFPYRCRQSLWLCTCVHVDVLLLCVIVCCRTATILKKKCWYRFNIYNLM